MVRSLRIEFPGALYHVISGGIGQMVIYHNDRDRKKFLHFQERVMKQFNWVCHAYCLMENHYHLLVETPDPNLSRGMKLLNQLYSQFYNFRYRRSGPVFQGRYKAWIVEKEDQYLENCRYIVNNPVRSHVVGHPSNWPWSSFNATCGNEKSPSYLHPNLVLAHFSSSRAKARRMYEEFVVAGNCDSSPFFDVRNQIFLGSEAFVNEILRNIHDRNLPREVPRKHLLAGRPSLHELFDGEVSRSKKNRNRQIRAAFEEHLYTLREIGSFLGLHPDYLSRLLRQMRKENSGT